MLLELFEPTVGSDSIQGASQNLPINEGGASAVQTAEPVQYFEKKPRPFLNNSSSTHIFVEESQKLVFLVIVAKKIPQFKV